MLSTNALLAESTVTLYKSKDFTGTKKEITETWTAAKNVGWNDSINSIKVPPGWKIIIYEASRIKGRSLTLTKDWVADASWTNKISNIDVIEKPKDMINKVVPGANKDETAGPKLITAPAFKDRIIEHHNKYRKQHGVPALIWDDEIAKVAEKWAMHLGRVGTIGHNPGRSGLGENVYAIGKGPVGGEKPFWGWYAEYGQLSCQRTPGMHCGHFTQVVWKSSTKFGCGQALSEWGKSFIVCNYSPAGNVQGHFDANVPVPVCAQAAHKTWLSALGACAKKKACEDKANAEWTEAVKCLHKF